MTQKQLLFLGNQEDRPYLHSLKPHIGDNKCYVLTPKSVSTLFEISSYCRARNISGVLTTRTDVVRKLAGRDKVSIDNYAGSYFSSNNLEWVVLDPLEHTRTVPYGNFLLERFISKLTHPEKWMQTLPFSWSLVETHNADEAIRFLSECFTIAADIETFKDPLSIRCIGFTGLRRSSAGEYSVGSYVLPFDSLAGLAIARKICALPAPKVFQNGKYDLSYLARYNVIVHNYLWDTATMMHSWYSELPKDLGFLQAFFVREASYWKDLAETNDLEQYYKYNAKDTWATLFAALAWINEAPDWAKENYQKEFPLLFACHFCEMIGIKQDAAQVEASATEVDQMVAAKSASLDRMLGVTGFNVNSPKHMEQLFKTLGLVGKGWESRDDKHMAKAAFKHPLNARIINLIRGVPKSDDPELMGIRALRKVRSTYLQTDKAFSGRMLYALNPHGTDSGRLASKEHHFWCGLQIQNIPSGKLVKSTLVADEGFYIGESDLEQAETRDTAYITGDPNLIAAVNSGRDFHSVNTSAFFGVPYESVYDEATKKTINKPLRDLAKRVNHGANYNMGPKVMVDTMGEAKIYEAAKLLGLPAGLDAEGIATELLNRFASAYPVVRFDYQQWVIQPIVTTKKLVGATGWTRYCFSDPRTSKPALNSYISHPPQSLNAMVLNQAFMRVFYDLAIHPEHSKNFRLLAQIHDSILFQYREGHDYLPEMVRERMEIPITIKDIKGVERTFTVPAALKIGKVKDGKLVRAKRWSETE